MSNSGIPINKPEDAMLHQSNGFPDDSEAFEDSVYRKITWRIIPFLFLCYIFAYIDRVNVGFAMLQMQQDLGMSDAVYGAGAGIFFIGYFFFEVPCNIALQKIGAKYWLGPIMIVWGVVSGCTMFVRNSLDFYAIRFLLGIVESGFFPGVILYLTFWYTRKHRAKMVAAFMTAIPLSGVIGGPISGWLLETMSSVGGLKGWQWLYVFEALPSIVAGLIAMFFLVDGPHKAKWLTERERAIVTRDLAAEEHAKKATGGGHHTIADAFRSLKVWLLCLVYFGFVMGNYGISFWLPQIVKDTITKDSFHIGLLTAIPWAAGAIAMVVVGHHSDRTGERRWHIAITGIIGAAAFVSSGIPGISGGLGLAFLTIATAGLACAYSTFWSLPTSILSGTAASAGIAWINSVGNLAGYFSPYLVGKIRDTTQNMTLALLMLAFFSLLSAIVTVTAFKPFRHRLTTRVNV
jgi:MFS family permease